MPGFHLQLQTALPLLGPRESRARQPAARAPRSGAQCWEGSPQPVAVTLHSTHAPAPGRWALEPDHSRAPPLPGPWDCQPGTVQVPADVSPVDLGGRQLPLLLIRVRL